MHRQQVKHRVGDLARPIDGCGQCPPCACRPIESNQDAVRAKAVAGVAYAELRLSSLHVGHAVVDVGCSSGASGVTLLDVDLEMPYARFAQRIGVVPDFARGEHLERLFEASHTSFS